MSDMKTFRIFNGRTDETIMLFEAKDFIEASRIMSKFYDDETSDADFEEVKE